MCKKVKSKTNENPIVKVWVIINSVPTMHFGVLVKRYSGDVWYVSKSLKSKTVRVIKADEVYTSSSLAFASLVKIVVYFVENDHVVGVKGYRRGNGTLAGVYANGSTVAFRTLFTTKVKAERELLRNLSLERHVLTKRLKKIDCVLRSFLHDN